MPPRSAITVGVLCLSLSSPALAQEKAGVEAMQSGFTGWLRNAAYHP